MSYHHATAYNSARYQGKQLALCVGVSLICASLTWYMKERNFRRHPEAKPREEVVEQLRTRYHYAGNAWRQDFNAFDYSHVSQVGLRTIESKEPLEEDEIEERNARLEQLKEEVSRALKGASLDAVWEEEVEEE